MGCSLKKEHNLIKNSEEFTTQWGKRQAGGAGGVQMGRGDSSLRDEWV